jgi:hypothetical protein
MEDQRYLPIDAASPLKSINMNHPLDLQVLLSEQILLLDVSLLDMPSGCLSYFDTPHMILRMTCLVH